MSDEKLDLPKEVIDHYNDILLKKQTATFIPDKYDSKCLPPAMSEPHGKLIWINRSNEE